MKPFPAACALSAIVTLCATSAFAQASTPDGSGQAPAPAPASPAAPAAAPASATADQAALKAQWEAVTAAKVAEKAAHEAETAAIQAAAATKAAKNGTVTGQTTIQGTVQVSEGGPKAEALLMTSRGALSAGKVIREDLESVFSQPAYAERPVILATSVAQLATSALTAFEVRRTTLQGQLDAAHRRFVTEIHNPREVERLLKAPETGAGGNRFALAAAAASIGQALDIGSKLASYLKTDYTFGQVTVETEPDLYAYAIVRSFRDSTVAHPRFYASTHLTGGAVEGLIRDLTALQDSHGRAATDQAIATKIATDLRAKAADDKANAPALLAAAARYEAFAATTGKWVDATETFLTGLFVETAEKPAPIVRIAQERQVQRLIAKDALILLVTGKPAAAYYTKKSLWTNIFGAPLHTMGGANVTYSLYDAGSGLVVTDGVVPVHGGYLNVRDVQRLFPAR